MWAGQFSPAASPLSIFHSGEAAVLRWIGLGDRLRHPRAEPQKIAVNCLNSASCCESLLSKRVETDFLVLLLSLFDFKCLHSIKCNLQHNPALDNSHQKGA